MEFSFNLDPIENFRSLFQQAIDHQIPDANAMTLATCGSNGKPSARIVLYKGLLRNGFTFYTNYESRKGYEISENPLACLVFFWSPLEVQVRIEGTVERLSDEESQRYFSTRPRLSQIGAWASQQSQTLSSFEEFEEQVNSFDAKFKHQEVIQCPPFWGGYRVEPTSMEFWFGRQGRLHRRYLYQRVKEGWKRLLLSP